MYNFQDRGGNQSGFTNASSSLSINDNGPEIYRCIAQ